LTRPKEDAAVIDLLGMVVFGTIVGIGLLDGRRGLSVFASYHWDRVPGGQEQAPATKRNGGGNQPKPPTAAR
jgi:hypothetical protein